MKFFFEVWFYWSYFLEKAVLPFMHLSYATTVVIFNLLLSKCAVHVRTPNTLNTSKRLFIGESKSWVVVWRTNRMCRSDLKGSIKRMLWLISWGVTFLAWGKRLRRRKARLLGHLHVILFLFPLNLKEIFADDPVITSVTVNQLFQRTFKRSLLPCISPSSIFWWSQFHHSF